MIYHEDVQKESKKESRGRTTVAKMSINPAIISLGTGMLLPQNNRIGVNDFVVHMASQTVAYELFDCVILPLQMCIKPIFATYVCWTLLEANCGQLVS